MVKLVFTTVMVILLASCSEQKTELSEQQRNQIEQEVMTAFESLVDAATTLDVEQYFMHFDSVKFVGLNSNGMNWNSIDDLKPVIASGFGSIAEVKSLDFTNVNLSVVDQNTCVLVNEYQQVLLLKDGSSVEVAGGGAQVWSKADGSWKLVSISASTKAPEE